MRALFCSRMLATAVSTCAEKTNSAGRWFSSEISGAIVSITLVMASVFIPVSFVTGSAGVFYRQFGITLAIAICISAINALTLCPALAAMFLRPPDHGHDNKKKNLLQRFGAGFNKRYEGLTERYSRSVTFLSARKWLVISE